MLSKSQHKCHILFHLKKKTQLSLCGDVWCVPNVQSHNVCLLRYCNVLKWPKVQQQSLNMAEWPGCGAPDLRPPPPLSDTLLSLDSSPPSLARIYSQCLDVRERHKYHKYQKTQIPPGHKYQI